MRRGKILIISTVSLIFLFSLSLFLYSKFKKPTEKVINIEVWDFARPQEIRDWEQAVFKKFKEEYPNVKIHFTLIPWARGDEKLDIAVASGTYPDIAGSAMRPSYVVQGVLEPLDEYLSEEEKQDIYPEPLKVCQFEGKTYAFPWYSTVYLTILNVDIFKERKVDLPKDGIWTWEEFLEKMKKLTFDRDGDGKIDVYGIGFGVAPGTGEAWGIIYSDGGRFYNDDMTEMILNQEAGVSGVQKLVDLEHKYKVALPNAGGLTPSGDVWNAFVGKDRRLAATFQGQWAIMALTKRNKKIDDRDPEAVAQKWEKLNFAVAVTPIGKSGKITTASPGVGTWVVFKQNDPVKRKLCVELAKRLALSDEAQKIISYLGVLPTRKSIGNIYGDNPHMAVVYKAYEHVIMPPFHPEGSKMDDIIQRSIQQALVLEKSTVQALNDAAKRVNLILKHYNEMRSIEKRSGAQARRLTPKQTMTLISIVILGLLATILGIFILRLPNPKKFIKKNFYAYLFITPSLLVFTVFTLMPVTYAILLAFQRFSVMGSTWVGLANFKKIFFGEERDIFLIALKNTLVYTLIMVPEGITVALILASIIHPLPRKIQTFFRSAYYLPGVISGVIISMVWKWIYDPTFGLFNYLLSIIIKKLSNYRLATYALELSPHFLPWVVAILIFGVACYFLSRLFIAIFASILKTVRNLCAQKSALSEKVGLSRNPHTITLPSVFSKPSSLIGKLIYYTSLAIATLGAAWIVKIVVVEPVFTAVTTYLTKLKTAGIEGIPWLTHPSIALFSIMLASMLMAPGGGVILFLAAMGRIPKELHESAMIDGANAIRRWWNVTVPLLKPTILYLLVMGTIGSFQVFTNIYIMTGGGPGYASTPLVMLIFNKGFKHFEFGLASALALILFAMVVTVAVLQFKFLSTDVEY